MHVETMSCVAVLTFQVNPVLDDEAGKKKQALVSHNSAYSGGHNHRQQRAYYTVYRIKLPSAFLRPQGANHA
jgi:hypothetical protein